MNFENLLISTSLFAIAGITDLCHTLSFFTWVLGNWTQVLIPIWQELQQLSHLPNSYFLICYYYCYTLSRVQLMFWQINSLLDELVGQMTQNTNSTTYWNNPWTLILSIDRFRQNWNTGHRRHWNWRWRGQNSQRRWKGYTTCLFWNSVLLGIKEPQCLVCD